MKKVLHVLVPLLLIILIFSSIVWYLFEYDPDFTRDMLLKQARYQDQVGNHAAAVWFYDIAYLQSDRDDNVALELADQYISIGNYSKAEYTLSNAIADGGNIELYISLCNIYVAQNKLLDAVTMLNNIADPNIKAQLSALRPEVPAPSHAPGSYSQYIQLSFTAAGGSCYISSDRLYPSLDDHAYLEPFNLPAGESVFYGVTVAENGLVSPLGIYSYIVGGVIEEVKFTNTDVEQAVRRQMGYSDDRVIYSNELWEMKELTMPSSVTDYSDLKWMPNLQKLVISNGSFTKLDPIAQLSKLQTLTITDSVLSPADVKVIASLPELKELTMRGCQLSTISNLANATKLTYLDISDNTIRDISVLSKMKGLEQLHMDHNALINLDAVSGMINLKVLKVSHNSLVSTAPVAGLYNLTVLDVSYNGLMALDGIDKLSNLKEFYGTDNNLINIDALSACAGMLKLDVSNNTLLNIDPVANMPLLEELSFAHNEVAALPEFSKDAALWTIHGEYNLITSLEPLAHLHSLSYVYMDYNEGITTADCLQTCHLLLTVSIYGTKVSDVQVLRDMSVKVYYDPT